ncbi:MAG: hypothetical protein LBK70_01575 [Clostridiales bacterium]|jgi:F-type H+-transporting ATPase subunit b|nr:hypothetical protein [Clostridiales bacterium]
MLSLPTFVAVTVFDNLGLTWQELIFHAITLLVLVLFLWLLLYKPTKKMIGEKRAKAEEVFKINQKLKSEAEQTKAETENLLFKAKQDAMTIATMATANAEEKAKQIIQDAEQQATAIINIAHKESMVEITRMENEFRDNAADIVIDLVGKIISRELKTEDNEKFIADCLDEWETK